MKTNRFTHMIAPALLLGLLFFSCKNTVEEKPVAAAPAVPAELRVVATVNGDPIMLAEFQERFRRAGFKPEREAEPAVMEEFLNRLIERKMMLSEAQKRRIKVGLPEINQRIDTLRGEHGKDMTDLFAGQGVDFEKWKSDIWEDMMIERLLAHDVHRQTSVSSAEVKRYYQANPQEFDKPAQVRVRQIVLTSEEDAQKVLEQLRAKGADFAAVARAKSTAPEAENGGDLGYFALGDMPAEFNAVFSLPKGGMSGIVKSPYGFHIFKLEDRRKAGRISLEAAYKEISERLRREQEDMRYKLWLKELRARTQFEVNYQALEQ